MPKIQLLLQLLLLLPLLLATSLVNQTTPFPSTGCIASPARGREWSGIRDYTATATASATAIQLLLQLVLQQIKLHTYD